MQYDVAVIGSGPGGYVAAIKCAQLGLKTACIEKNGVLGGTCLNVGCIPSKALLHSSELYWKIGHDVAKHGIKATARVDFGQMMERKRGVVTGFNAGISGLFQKNKVDWIKGEARLKTATSIDVGGKTVEAKNIILATGSEPIPLPFLPFDEKKVVSSTGALAFETIPKKLLIIGAGIIGVELGSVYSRLGSEVLFLEFLDRICPGFDGAISKALQKSLTAQGMLFCLSHKVTAATVDKTVTLTANNTQFTGDAVLVAIGRRPYSANLGLETLGIQKDPKGFVQIDDTFRTSVPNIFAIGDLVNGPMLAHKAEDEGIAVAELIAGHHPTIDYACIPNVAYTSPEVAAVGFTEEELKAKNIPYSTGQFPFKANSRARSIGEDEGFVKLLAHKETGRILGVHIIGSHASELIGEATVAMQKRTTATELANTCHAHPTLSEALKEAAMAAVGKPIHL
jgi:dihydrolipoamide dehydrogenase